MKEHLLYWRFEDKTPYKPRPSAQELIEKAGWVKPSKHKNRKRPRN